MGNWRLESGEVERGEVAREEGEAMGGMARRRALVEVALLREGERLNMSALARELGVSRWAVRRDVARVRERWTAVERVAGRDLDTERARTAAAYEAVAVRAMEQYLRLVAEAPAHTVTVGCLRTALEALEKRSQLLGLRGWRT